MEMTMVRKSTCKWVFTVPFGLALACAAVAKPPEAKLTTEHFFAPAEGQWPSLEATLVQGPGHKVYGILGSGGPH
ncbi:MAG: hypothetical protein ABUL69_02955, partial [Peristeroidobacter soli]